MIESNVTLTPDKAKEFINTSKRNRNISATVAKRYALLIEHDEWMSNNAQPIIFDWNGRLRDGQHRCEAVIISGKSILVDIAHNVNPDAIRSVDCGKLRTPGDTLIMENKERRPDFKYAMPIAAALRIVYNHLEGNIYLRDKVDNDTIYELFEEHPKIMDSAELICSRRTLTSRAILCSLHYITKYVLNTNEIADEFFSKFISGENLKSGDPVLVLRNKFINHKSAGKSYIRPNFVISCIIKTWEAHRNGQKIKSVTYNPDSLPELRKRKIYGIIK